MGFAQEIKDFLSAAQAGQKIFGAKNDEEYKRLRNQRLQQQIDKDNDPEADKLKKDELRARIRARDASIGLTNARTGLVGEQRRRLRDMPAVGSAPQLDMTAPEFAPREPYQTPAVPAAPGPQSAIEPPNQFASAEGDPDMEDRMFSATGGYVQRFAAGGMVDDGPDDEPDADEDDYAPEAAIPAAAPTDVSARSRTPTSFSQEAAHDAVKDGLNFGVKSFGLDRPAAVSDNGRGQQYRAYATGRGAAPVADMNAIRKAVDPQGKMSESERNLAALSAVYQFKLNRGDTKGAQSAAFAMLQHYRIASQRYAAIAHAAAEQGDIDGAAKAAMRAYANIPDGKDLKITRAKDGQLAYSFVDEQTGKTISKGIASPQQLASAAMGVASQGFDQFLLDAAGQRAAGGKKPAVGGKQSSMKQSDLKSLRESVDGTIDDFVTTKTEGGAKFEPAQVQALKNSAFHIARENPNLTPSEAFEAARTIITSSGEQKPGNQPFEIEKTENGNRITFGDTGREIMMSDAELRPIMVLRGKRLQEANKERDKELESNKKGSFGAKAMKAIGAVDDAAGAAFGQAVDRSVQSVKSTARKYLPELGGRAEAAEDDGQVRPPISR